MTDEVSRQIKLNIQGDMDLRRGVYSNFFSAMDSGGDTILDFCFIDIDGIDDEGNAVKEGVVVSRVIIGRDRLVELRDMIDAHLLGADGGAGAVERVLDR